MKNGFEGAALERLDFEKMHQKAAESIDDSRIEEEDFRELYGDQVTTDLERVGRLEKQFAAHGSEESAEMKKVADIFEALVLDCGELNNWFGDNAFTIKTSRFDDYVNGMDMVLEFRGEEEGSASFLGVAADVTFTSDTTKKFDRIRDHIDKGELGKVKYFRSEHMNIDGQLSKLPEVVIGASKKTVMELANLWLEKNQEELAKHYAQIMVLRQMREQLETFSLYARSVGQQESADIYSSRIGIIDGILAEKAQIEREVGWNADSDSVHSEIMSFLKRWKASLKPHV